MKLQAVKTAKVFLQSFLYFQPTCDNHDDGETPAIILCMECGNMCVSYLYCVMFCFSQHVTTMMMEKLRPLFCVWSVVICVYHICIV